MHRLGLGCILLVFLLLCSCSIGANREQILRQEDDEDMATNRLEQILNAIENRDTMAMTKMFSVQVQKDAEDMGEEIEYLFTLVDERIEKWDVIGGIS